MLKYTYEELTSEEKQFIQYIQKNPLVTPDTLFGEEYYNAVKKITIGKVSIALKIYVIVIIILNFYGLLYHTKNSEDSLFYLFLIVLSGTFLFSLYKLGKGKLSKTNPILQKEVHLQNIRVMELTLSQNRKPLNVEIIKETPKYFKVRYVTLNNKVGRVSKKNESSWRVICTDTHYALYCRFSVFKSLHLKITHENFEALNSEFLHFRMVEQGEDEVSKEAYECLVEESKETPFFIREQFIYTGLYGFLFVPFIIFTMYVIFTKMFFW